ncbi:MAG: biopolymer transporter ExbD [Pseudomonadota bacterium]
MSLSLDTPSPRQPRESIVPMINVVFLLLIFFVMTAALTPPEQLDVTPPTSDTEVAAQEAVKLYIDADGQIGYDDLLGDEALAALAETPPAALIIRADADARGTALAQVIAAANAAEIGSITLATGARR